MQGIIANVYNWLSQSASIRKAERASLIQSGHFGFMINDGLVEDVSQ